MGNPQQSEQTDQPDPEACAPPQEACATSHPPGVNLTVVVQQPGPAMPRLPLALLFMVLFTFCLVMLFVPMIAAGYHTMLYQ